MALNLAGLGQNIQNAISAFTGLFTGGKGKLPYPDKGKIANVITGIDDLESNWAKSLPYGFGVIDITDGVENISSEFKSIDLPINPSELTQDENFAINIKPTQGGTVVQHSGNKYKDLTISGTTGNHPFKGSGGASSRTGKALFQPQETKFKSGFYNFHLLRNWFRSYYEFKKLNTDKRSRDLRIIFKNRKDGESLIVELTKFSLKRNGDRPFLYDYNLTFKVLGNANFVDDQQLGGILGILADIDNTFNTALEYIDTARAVFVRSQDILRQVESNFEAVLVEPLRKTRQAVIAFLGVPSTAADMGNKLIREFNSEALALALLVGLKDEQAEQRNAPTQDPLLVEHNLPVNLEQSAKTDGVNFLLRDENQDLLQFIDPTQFPSDAQAQLDSDIQDSLELERDFYVTFREDLVRLRDNAADKFNLGSDEYNEQQGRTATFEPEVGKNATDDEFALLDAFNSSIRALDLMLSTQILFKSEYEERIASIQAGFNDDLNLTAESALKEIPMPPNTDLERLALNELGAADKWIEISELNNLKPPYVIQDKTDPTPNVIHPGDLILIPQPVIEGFGNIQPNHDIPVIADLTATEKNLGLDLKLTSEFDIELTNRNDVQITTAAENAAQAIILKLTYEQGDLLKHPSVGVGLQVGSKNVTPINELRDSLIQSLQRDPRFSRIENLQIDRRNNEVFLTFTAFIKNVDTPVPVKLKL